MKTFNILILGFAFLMSSLISSVALGQGPPPWAPAKGYRAQEQARYIYYPQHNFYYDMQRSTYIYADGPHWYISPALPAVYAWINLGNSMQVALDFYGDQPHMHNPYHSEKHRHKAHHKAWKKQNKEWEKREKQWAKEYDKRHKHCGHSCRDYRYEEPRREVRREERRSERPAGRVRVDVRF